MFNKTLKSASVSARTAAGELQDEFDNMSSQYGAKARKLLEAAQGEFNDINEVVTREIKANPWRSGLIAMGLGIVVGALITRTEK